MPQLGSGSSLGSKHFPPPSKTWGANRTQLWMLCGWSKCRAPEAPGASTAHLGCMARFLSSSSLNCRRESSSTGLCLLHHGVREGAALPAQSALQLCRLRENFKVDHKRKCSYDAGVTSAPKQEFCCTHQATDPQQGTDPSTESSARLRSQRASLQEGEKPSSSNQKCCITLSGKPGA